MRHIVENPSYYTGRYKPHPIWVPDHEVSIPPLVSEADWQTAQRVLGRVRAAPIRDLRYPFLLRGLVRCAHCGRSMRAHSVTGGRNPYYDCIYSTRDPLNGARCPSAGRGRADEIDAHVWRHLSRLLREPGALAAEMSKALDASTPAGEDPVATLQRITRELTTFDEERARLIRVFRKGLISEDELSAELEDLDRRRKPLTQQKELVLLRQRERSSTLARISAIEERLSAVRAKLDTLSFEQQRALVMELVDEVRLDPKEKRIEVVCLLAEDGGPGGGDGEEAGEVVETQMAEIRLKKRSNGRTWKAPKGVSGVYGNDKGVHRPLSPRANTDF